MKRRAIIPIFLPQAGCPKPPCCFCNQQVLTDLDAMRSPEEVSAFVSYSLRKINRQRFAGAEVALYGGSFTALSLAEQRRYLQALTPFVRRGEISAIRLSTHPNFIEEKTLLQLRDSAVETIELGVQSFDDEVLRLSQRGYDTTTAIDSARLILAAGFKLGIHLMVGLPGDTPEKALRSVGLTISLSPQFVRIHPTLVLRGTKLHQMLGNGEYIPWEEEKMLATLSEMLESFDGAGIKVSRLGLQPSQRMIKDKAVVAGLFHPALREICEIFLLAKNLAKKIKEQRLDSNQAVQILAGRKIYQKLMCHHQEGKRQLAKMLEPGKHVYLEKDNSLLPEEFLVLPAGAELYRNSLF